MAALSIACKGGEISTKSNLQLVIAVVGFIVAVAARGK